MQFELKNGNMTATVDSLGGELVSLRDSLGRERIWWGDPAVWAGHNPLLFPIVGRLHDDTVEINGSAYSMKQHGLARKMEFALLDRRKDSITLALESSSETQSLYPFDFRLEVTHALLESGFETAVCVKNTGNAPMPFCLGAHTGFVCPLDDGESLEDYILRFPEEENAVSIPIIDGAGLDPEGSGIALHGRELPVKYDYFEKLDTVIFDGLKSRSVELVNPATGHGVRMDYPGFPMVAFWTKPGARAPYLCIEPWHGCAWQKGESGRFEDKPYCITLVPGGEKMLSYTAQMI